MLHGELEEKGRLVELMQGQEKALKDEIRCEREARTGGLLQRPPPLPLVTRLLAPPDDAPALWPECSVRSDLISAIDPHEGTPASHLEEGKRAQFDCGWFALPAWCTRRKSCWH